MTRTDYNLPVFEDTDVADLNEYTEELAEALKVQIDKFGFPLIYKGTVATLEDLPESDVGSIYSVTSENKNYVWNGSDWIEYSTTLDLSYLKDNLSVVSPTEPTTSEEVWIKKGKNLIDTSKLTIGTADHSTGKYRYTTISVVTDYMPVSAGLYTAKLFNASTIRIYRVVGYDANKNYLFDDTELDVTERANTFSTTKYIRICFKKGAYEDGITVQDVINAQPQFEQGPATTYEEYVDKQVYCKNLNGIYEKFLEEKNIVEKTINANGTAIKYADGTMICFGAIVKTLNISTSYEGGFYGAIGTTNFPQTFKEVPIVNATIAQSNSIVAFNIAGKSTSHFSGYIWKLQSKSNVECTINYIAIGYWA